MNIAVDERSSPYYALRDRQGNAIGVTACDIDGDGREEIYFLNTNNAFSGKGWGPRASPGPPLLPPGTRLLSPASPGPHSIPTETAPGGPVLLLCMKLFLTSQPLEREALSRRPVPSLGLYVILASQSERQPGPPN